MGLCPLSCAYATVVTILRVVIQRISGWGLGPITIGTGKTRVGAMDHGESERIMCVLLRNR
jgi:hypothetical protein